MTTRSDIERWLLRAEPKHTHMIVVVDSFSYEDYPIFVSHDEDVREVAQKYNEKSMQRIMEVYNLGMDIEAQLNERRAFNY
ncbi:hypothetical protein LCGC14_2981650 [marine sediment metagenome]|uniref:Uncharacterized protein n=1 Tax=marine sediment metagenome TaxID=412755 RepID=A0A0F8X6C8_9ZZZZ|nr:hypothetical protein [bacterium]